MTEYADTSTVLNLYLGGYFNVPDIEERLRSNVMAVNVDVDVDGYMAFNGRYSYPSRAKVVQDFFAGNISSILGSVDPDGVTRLTLADYKDLMSEGWSDDIFSVSNYTTDVGTADYGERAFIWGTSGFRIDDGATFAWGSDGSVWIENMAVEPSQENFDLAAGNEWAQLVNDIILDKLVDPYNIGRKVFFNFDATEVANYVSATAIESYDLNSFNLDVAATNSVTWAIDPFSFEAELIQSALEVYNAVKPYYIDEDGRDIIYGTAGPDDLSLSDMVWTTDFLADFNIVKAPSPDVGVVLVGGDGADTLVGTEHDDRLYGGAGNDNIDCGELDIVYAGSGADSITIDGSAVVFGGDGNDTITLNADVSSGHSTITGEVGNDTIAVFGNFQKLNVNFNSGDGNDVITTDTVFEIENEITLISEIDNSNFDVAIDVESHTYLYGDPDKSTWEVTADVLFSSGSDSIKVESVKMNISTPGSSWGTEYVHDANFIGLSLNEYQGLLESEWSYYSSVSFV